MSQQIQLTGGAKVRSLEGVITGTSGVLSSVPLGAANGVATLDSLGKVPLSQLPASVVTYLGTWNAATNTPTLVNGTGDTGDLYICNVAGTVNFGAGPITFAVGDWVIYSGTIWQKSSGASGTVTSVGLSTNGGAITISNSPITTSGTITANFNGTSSQYVNGAGNLTTFPTLISSIGLSMPSAFSVANSPLTANGTIAVTGAGTSSQYIDGTGALQSFPALTGYVPYTGATSDVDLGTHILNAQALHIKGTAGNGHLGLKHQSATPSGSANESLIYANVNGDLGWLNDNLYLSTFNTHANTANRVYTFPNASGTIALTSDISYPVTSVFGRTGAVTAQSGDYTTTQVTEGTNLYFTNTRAQNAISLTTTGTSGAATYSGGVLNIPNYGSALSGYVPYTGATTNVNLGSYEIKANNLIGENSLSLKHLASGTPSLIGYTTISGYVDSLVFAQETSGGYIKKFSFDLSNLSNSGLYTYTLPIASGTFALLESTQTFTGSKTFSSLASFTNTAGTNTQYGIYIQKGYTPTAFSTTTTNIYSATTTNNLVIKDSNSTANLVFNNSTQTYTFPAATGTIALTSNLSSYVPYTGATSDIDTGNFSIYSNYLDLKGAIYINGNTTNGAINFISNKGGAIYRTQNAINITPASTTSLDFTFGNASSVVKNFRLEASSLTDSTLRTYTLPDATGTIALISNLSSYVPYTGATTNVNLGSNSITASVATFTNATLNGNGTNPANLYLKKGSLPFFTNVANYGVIGAMSTELIFATDVDGTNYKFASLSLASLTNNTNRIYTLPDSSGTIALTSNIPTVSGTTNYVPKFTASTTLGNSSIYEGTSGYVSIGNTNTSYNLDVSGTGRFTSGLLVDSLWATGSIGGGNGTTVQNLNLLSANLIFQTGTAGSASWTEKMRLTAAGSLGIGNSSPSYTLDVTGTIRGTTSAYFGTSSGNIGLGTTTIDTSGGLYTCVTVDSSTYSRFALQSSGTAKGRFQFDATNVSLGATATGGKLQLFTLGSYAMEFATNDTNRMTITSGGNVGIGTTTTTGILNLGVSSGATNLNIFNLAGQYGNVVFNESGGNKAYLQYISATFGTAARQNSLEFGTLSNAFIAFRPNDAEAMRITSGGNVEIANGYLSTSAGSGTAYSSKLSTDYTYPYIDTYLDSIAGTSYQSRLRFRLNTAAGAMEDKLILWYNGSVTFSGLSGSGTRSVSVLSDGTLTASSDSRLKEEDKNYKIAGLNEILQINPKAYKWKSDIEQRGNDAQTELGFFADEVASIIPSAAPKGFDDYYGFNDRAIIATLVKAIQEQNQLIQELRTDIELLKNK